MYRKLPISIALSMLVAAIISAYYLRSSSSLQKDEVSPHSQNSTPIRHSLNTQSAFIQKLSRGLNKRSLAILSHRAFASDRTDERWDTLSDCPG